MLTSEEIFELNRKCETYIVNDEKLLAMWKNDNVTTATVTVTNDGRTVHKRDAANMAINES